jgi:hypothetical protein
VWSFNRMDQAVGGRKRRQKICSVVTVPRIEGRGTHLLFAALKLGGLI